jgi:hypothetical protein
MDAAAVAPAGELICGIDRRAGSEHPQPLTPAGVRKENRAR